MGWIFGLGVVLIVGISGVIMGCLYQIVVMDAKSRGEKKPNFWGIFAAGSQNGSGLLWYLARRHEVITPLNAKDRQKISKLKNKIYLLFMMDVMALIFSLVAMFHLKD